MTDDEIDDAIAEKMFGWFRIDNAVINDRNTGPCWWHHNYGDPLHPFPGARATFYPMYTVDMEYAWQVVDKLIELGVRTFRLEYDRDYGVDHREGWSVCIGIHMRAMFVDTAPRAICIAALEHLRLMPPTAPTSAASAPSPQADAHAHS